MDLDLDLIESDLISDVLDELRPLAKAQALVVFGRCGGDLELALDVVKAASGEDGMADVCRMMESEMSDSWFPSTGRHHNKTTKADDIGEDKFNQESGR